jgi:hypothetical protein
MEDLRGRCPGPDMISPKRMANTSTDRSQDSVLNEVPTSLKYVG